MKGTAAHEHDVIAHVSWNAATILVSAEDAETVAQRLGVRDLSADEWVVKGPDEEEKACFVAFVPDPLWLADLPAARSDLRVRKGYRCSGNRPPGWHDTGCMPAPEGKWYEVKQSVGYSFCEESSQPDYICEEALVQVGDWIYYSDQCQTETRRVPLMKWVCFL